MQQEQITHITSKSSFFDFDLKELLRYKDLIFLFVKRNFQVSYKQTILGPLWLLIRPVLTVLMYAFVFGVIANLSTDGIPQFGFYLASNTLWAFFASCLTETSATFLTNARLLEKVYFPRLVMPITSVITASVNMLIQFVILVVLLVYYQLTGAGIAIGLHLLYVPILMLQTGLLGMGCGIIIASLTIKYRDLSFLLTFGVQLWMYASPVVYSLTQIPQGYWWIYMINPIAPIISLWRYAVFGVGAISIFYWGISWITTFVMLMAGVMIFNKVEKTFADTI